MIKLLAREGLFRLLRSEQQQHCDIHKHFFGELLQKLPDFRFTLEAVPAVKVWIDDPETDRHWTVPAPFNLCLGVSTFICRQNVQDLLNLPIRVGASI